MTWLTKGCTDWVRAFCSLRQSVHTSYRTLPASYMHMWRPRDLPMVQRLRSEVEHTHTHTYTHTHLFFFYFNKCTVHLLLLCTMTNKCTIISQIITLLHVSSLSYHPQGACNHYLVKLHKYMKCSCWYCNTVLYCNLAKYWLKPPWGWQDSVETCRSVIICEIIVHLLIIVQNIKNNIHLASKSGTRGHCVLVLHKQP
jgi:hypothetical protein